MSFYDAIKDAASLAQKADNIELYRQLLDLSAQALELQAENARLKEEISSLKKCQVLSSDIIRHVEPVITIKTDKDELYYCSHCWDSEQLLIQVSCHANGTFDCPHCHAKGNYSNERKRRADIQQRESIARINSKRRNIWDDRL